MRFSRPSTSASRAGSSPSVTRSCSPGSPTGTFESLTERCAVRSAADEPVDSRLDVARRAIAGRLVRLEDDLEDMAGVLRREDGVHLTPNVSYEMDGPALDDADRVVRHGKVVDPPLEAERA